MSGSMAIGMNERVSVSSQSILDAARTLGFDLRWARRILGFAIQAVGSWILAILNRRLERDTFTMRGLLASVRDLEGQVVLIDKNGEAAPLLVRYAGDVERIRASAARWQQTSEMLQFVQNCTALHQAIVQLKEAIALHDTEARLTAGEINANADSFEELFESFKSGKPVVSAETKALAEATSEQRDKRPDDRWARKLTWDVRDAHD